MKEIADVIVNTGEGFKRGNLHESGTLTVGGRPYAAWGGKVAESVEGRDGRLVTVEDVLIRDEDFDEITQELKDNEIEIGSRYNLKNP